MRERVGDGMQRRHVHAATPAMTTTIAVTVTVAVAVAVAAYITASVQLC